MDADTKRGIYGKYHVARVDGSSGPGGKHENCQVYGLDLVHDPFAIPALRAYAAACAREYPQLARDIEQAISSTGLPRP